VRRQAAARVDKEPGEFTKMNYPLFSFGHEFWNSQVDVDGMEINTYLN
jgi:hypothetical protein